MDPADLDAAIAATEAEIARLETRRTEAVERLHGLRAQRAAAAPEGDWSRSRKLALFRSLFRGRHDVFAVRWERPGRSGYAPKCVNEWKPGVCEKPRVRCAACPNQAFVAAGEDVLRDHLQGRTVVGIYPLLTDDTCWLLAIDLDGESWPRDVAALRRACADLDLVPAVERSRSGRGAHVWLFFSQPVAATDARALGTRLLTCAMASSPTLAMTSYDRLFPSQDTLPSGGFGNLIALPLQRLARDVGNTVFLDGHLEPHRDQWAFLASLPRITRQRLRELAAGEDALGVSEPGSDSSRPWRPAKPLARRLADAQLPTTLRATLAQRLYIERDELPAALLDAIRRLAAFANPEFAERQAMRLPTGLTPRVITCFEDLTHHIALPRGTADDLRALLAELGIAFDIADERSIGTALAATFTGTLRPEQATATRALREHDIGVLCAPPGAGKTVMAASLIADRARSTLVLVHRKPLVEQWVARLGECLDLDPNATASSSSRSQYDYVHVMAVPNPPVRC